MSNRVDFFLADYNKLAMPAGKVLVFVEGQASLYLEPIEIVRDIENFSLARFAYRPRTEAAGIDIEDIERIVPIGKDICIKQIYNGGVSGAGVYSFVIFAGQIEGIKTYIGPNGERAEITARDFSSSLERVTVYGRRVVKSANESLFLADVDTIFNENRKPNATKKPIAYNGKTFMAFCSHPDESKFWSCAEVIDYLLCEYLPEGYCARPAIEKLKALTEGKVIQDFDVTSLSLLEALKRCCKGCGINFKFVARQAGVGPKQAIVFYRPGKGRSVEINCQGKGERFSATKTNVTEFKSDKNFWPVTNRYIGQGDFKCYEATFELVKGWDRADESGEFDKFCPSSNEEFYKVKNVYRKWCLNEAGDYSKEPFNRGEAFDFRKIFGNEKFAIKRRRFYPALTMDNQKKSLGYYLQYSIDGGESWKQYPYSFNNLLDECGLWLSSDQLDFEIWAAAQEDRLRLRITATVISDERLSYRVADGPVGSSAAVVEHILTVPNQFKFRKISRASIFFRAKGIEADEVDDSKALREYVRQETGIRSSRIENIEVRTTSLMLDYQCGDRVTSDFKSRDLFKSLSDNRSISWIEKVHIDFEKQCTNLKIVRQRGKE